MSPRRNGVQQNEPGGKGNGTISIRPQRTRVNKSPMSRRALAQVFFYIHEPMGASPGFCLEREAFVKTGASAHRLILLNHDSMPMRSCASPAYLTASSKSPSAIRYSTSPFVVHTGRSANCFSTSLMPRVQFAFS